MRQFSVGGGAVQADCLLAVCQKCLLDRKHNKARGHGPTLDRYLAARMAEEMVVAADRAMAEEDARLARLDRAADAERLACEAYLREVDA